MAIKSDEIVNIIKSAIDTFDANAETRNVGTVVEVGDGIAQIYGLEGALASELLEFPGGVMGMALNLEEETVGAVILGNSSAIKEGDTVKTTGRVVEVPVGQALLGRVVDPLGKPLDDKGPIATTKTRPVERIAPGVIVRQSVDTPVQTGIKAIDALIPIGRGQRELIIGDRQTGKTAIAIDTIINNRDSGVISIYVAIGQRMATVVGGAQTLEEAGAMDNTIIIAAAADEAAPIKFLAPYAGAAIGEYFLWQGRHALIVYDDLTKHAYAYRQMSLLLRRPPGREAYPGDVFYLHSRLLERACKLNDELGGGSLTSLPIIETQAGDVSAYIPTNVISITDGQIFLEPKLFFSGVRPAINVGISVSRVGGSAQIGPMRKVAGRMKGELSQFRDLEAFASFGSDLDEDTQRTLARGNRLVATLNQGERQPVPAAEQVAIIFAATNGYVDRVAEERVPEFHQQLVGRLRAEASDLIEKIDGGDWSDETQSRLKDIVAEFADDFGYDLDEDGKPVDEEVEVEDRRRGREEQPAERGGAGGERSETG